MYPRIVIRSHSTKLKMSAVSKLSRAVRKLTPNSTTFFVLCHIQERFRPLVHNSDTIVTTAQYLTSTASELDIPIIATQQYTKLFGPIASDCFADGQEGVDDLIKKKSI